MMKGYVLALRMIVFRSGGCENGTSTGSSSSADGSSELLSSAAGAIGWNVVSWLRK